MKTAGTPFARHKRTAFTRSARTNAPLGPPEQWRSMGSVQGRRWRDLADAYSAQLADRLGDETVVARLRTLIFLTCELERFQDAPLAQQPRIETSLHIGQEIRTLIAELGLATQTKTTTPPTFIDIADEINAERGDAA